MIKKQIAAATRQLPPRPLSGVQQREIYRLDRGTGVVPATYPISQLVSRIAKEVLQEKGLPVDECAVVLIDYKEINAYFDHTRNMIVVYRGLLDLLVKENCFTEEALRFVLGHEIGHAKDDHDHRFQSYGETLIRELSADQHGSQSLASQAQNPLGGLACLTALEQAKRREGSSGVSITSTHPNPSLRRAVFLQHIRNHYTPGLGKALTPIDPKWLENIKTLESPVIDVLSESYLDTRSILKALNQCPTVGALRHFFDIDRHHRTADIESQLVQKLAELSKLPQIDAKKIVAAYLSHEKPTSFEDPATVLKVSVQLTSDIYYVTPGPESVFEIAAQQLPPQKLRALLPFVMHHSATRIGNHPYFNALFKTFHTIQDFLNLFQASCHTHTATQEEFGKFWGAVGENFSKTIRTKDDVQRVVDFCFQDPARFITVITDSGRPESVFTRALKDAVRNKIITPGDIVTMVQKYDAVLQAHPKWMGRVVGALQTCIQDAELPPEEKMAQYAALPHQFTHKRGYISLIYWREAQTLPHDQTPTPERHIEVVEKFIRYRQDPTQPLDSIQPSPYRHWYEPYVGSTRIKHFEHITNPDDQDRLFAAFNAAKAEYIHYYSQARVDDMTAHLVLTWYLPRLGITAALLDMLPTTSLNHDALEPFFRDKGLADTRLADTLCQKLPRFEEFPRTQKPLEDIKEYADFDPRQDGREETRSSFWSRNEESHLTINEAIFRDQQRRSGGDAAAIACRYMPASFRRDTHLVPTQDLFTCNPRDFDRWVVLHGTTERVHVLSLIHNPTLRDIAAKRLTQAKQEAGEFATMSYADIKAWVSLVFSSPNAPLAHEVLDDLLQHTTCTITDLDDFARTTAASSEQFIASDILLRLGDFLSNQTPDFKRTLFEWLLDPTQPKPKSVLYMEYVLETTMSDLPHLLTHLSQTERSYFFSLLFLDTNGILNDEATFKQLRANIFEKAMNESPTEQNLWFVLFEETLLAGSDLKQSELLTGLFQGFFGPGTPSSKPERIKSFLAAFGVVGIKLGQILSTHSAITDPALQAALRTLSDQVPPISKQYAVDALKLDGDGTEKLAQIASIDDLLGSASVKQGYRIRTTDGQTLAFKFIKPIAEYDVRENFEILERVMHSPRLQQHFKGADSLLEKVKISVQAEIDMASEVDHQVALRTFSLGRIPQVEGWTLAIPEVPPGFRGRKSFADQFSSGQSLAQTMDSLGDQTAPVAELVCRTVLDQIFNGDRFHADLHGGNVLVDPATKTVTLIDFGNCLHLSSEDQNHCLNLLLAVKLGLTQTAIHQFEVFCGQSEPFSPRLRRDLMTVLEKPGDLNQKLAQARQLLIQNQLTFQSQYEVVFKVLETMGYLFAPIQDRLQTLVIEVAGLERLRSLVPLQTVWNTEFTPTDQQAILVLLANLKAGRRNETIKQLRYFLRSSLSPQQVQALHEIIKRKAPIEEKALALLTKLVELQIPLTPLLQQLVHLHAQLTPYLTPGDSTATPATNLDLATLITPDQKQAVRAELGLRTRYRLWRTT
ncbi:MAG: AarF/UbiB family protein [Candidatus Margulisiibacteriota bacterium]